MWMWYLKTAGNVFDKPCGKLLDLKLRAKKNAKAGEYPITLLPVLDGAGQPTDSFLDKQGNPMSISLVSQREKFRMSGGWSGVYQEVESSGWQQEMEGNRDEMADLTCFPAV